MTTYIYQILMNLLITQNSQNLSHVHGLNNHTHTISHKHTKGSMRIQGTMQYVQFIYDGSKSGAFSLTDDSRTSAWSGNSDQKCKKVTFDTNNTNAWTGSTSDSDTANSGAASGNTTSSGGTEVRPVDYTYKIWKRTA